MAHLKSKSKSWQGASFGMCNEQHAIMFWEQGFTNMNFDADDAIQIELGKHKSENENKVF